MKFIQLFVFLLIGSSIFAQFPGSATRYEHVRAEFVSNDNEPSPLRASVDLNLQSELMTQLNKNPKYRQLIASKKMAVSLVDLSNPTDPSFAAVNGDHMMYAASLPKIAVLFASMDAIEKGQLEATPTIWQDMKMMIAKSNNAATTRMIDRVGFKKIHSILRNPRYNFYDQSRGGGLWVGKRYGSGGPRIGDPMKNISHAATATQVARFYYQMYHGQLISPRASEKMMDIMVDPQLHHKFVNTLDRVAPNAKVYRKSGSWKNAHSDSALVIDPVNPWRRYILVGLVEDPAGGTIMKDLVLQAERALRKRNDVRL